LSRDFNKNFNIFVHFPHKSKSIQAGFQPLYKKQKTNFKKGLLFAALCVKIFVVYEMVFADFGRHKNTVRR